MAIRVLVVDDSLTVRGAVIDALTADAGFEIVGEAADGQAAVRQCIELRPDVITMDVRMPKVSGVTATQTIMETCPTPILVLSAATDKAGQLTSYDALTAGAVDLMDKPKDHEDPDAWAARLRSAVRVVSRVKVIRRTGGGRAPREVPVPRKAARVIAIGASTGGPAAVLQLLATLPADLPVPVLVVIHIAAGFEDSLAEWLASNTRLDVQVARHGQPLPPTGVHLAPGHRHLRVAHGQLRLDDGPERHSCRPSVDVLFESVAREYGRDALAVLLTGMGRDGAAGLLELRRAGSLTWAQDEASSTIWGMPGEAVRIGAASRIAPPREIGEDLLRHLSPPPGGARWPAS